MDKAQKTRAKTPIIIFSVLVVVACVLRFFQLLKFTDAKSGYCVNGELSLEIYAVIGLVTVLSVIYAKRTDDTNKIFEFNKGDLAYYLSSVFLYIAFFVDFVHQCFNLYYYISKTAYIDYTYVVILLISMFFCISCSFYFAVLALTAHGRNYDFRSFKYFHFAPVMWGFTKLISIMLKIVDVRYNVDICIEFLFVCFMLMFFLCAVSSIDRKGKTGKTLVFSSLMTITLALVISLPKFALIFVDECDKVYNGGSTVLTYFAVGVMAFTVLNKTIKHN